MLNLTKVILVYLHRILTRKVQRFQCFVIFKILNLSNFHCHWCRITHTMKDKISILCIFLGYFMYADGTTGKPDQTIILETPFLANSISTCVLFYFNIFVSIFVWIKKITDFILNNQIILFFKVFFILH